jgi:hypothetical protein
MNYLKKYDITDEEINNIEKILEAAEVSVDMFKYNPEKIMGILDLFYDIGVRNIYEIIITNPYMFYDPIRSIKIRIDAYKNKDELARLINQDARNLDLIGLD